MADVPKAQVDADVAPGSAAAATGSPARLEVARRLFAPEATSTASPTLPLTQTPPPPREQPLTVESLSATVQQLMRGMEEQRIKMEEQRIKLEDQAKAIAPWEAGSAAAEGESTAAAEADWGYDHEGRWMETGSLVELAQ